MYPHQTVLFDTHGLGPFDFSALDEASLPALDRLAASRKAFLLSRLETYFGQLSVIAPTESS